VLVGSAAVVGLILVVGGEAEEPADIFVACSVSDADGGTVLTIRGKVTQSEADEGCDALAASLSGGGRYWRIGLPPSPDDYPEVVCVLNASDGDRGTATVEADPESFSSAASAICGELAHDGWTQFANEEVMGPWQRQFQDELEAQKEAERLEQAIREEEQAESQAMEDAVFGCEERAEAREEAELKAIEQETEKRMAEAHGEGEEYRMEEDGWQAEERAWQRGEAADARCQESAEGGVEYR
jgi:hypothetical protein